MSLLAFSLLIIQSASALPIAPATFYSRLEAIGALVNPSELYHRLPSMNKDISTRIDSNEYFQKGVALTFQPDIASQKEGFKIVKRFADVGHFGAQMETADAYRYGHGVPQDYKAALIYYRHAATNRKYEAAVFSEVLRMAKEDRNHVNSLDDYRKFAPPASLVLPQTTPHVEKGFGSFFELEALDAFPHSPRLQI